MRHFEVFILNFNGVHFLDDCLTSLQVLKTTSHTVEVNVIDNGSTDESAALVADKYPEARFISLGSNLGFSGGNNEGVRRRDKELAFEGRTSDFYVFLNNDTAVDPDWLIEAAKVFEKDQKIGIVGSKSVFYDQFISLNIKCHEGFSPKDFGSSDTRLLGTRLFEPIIGQNILNQESRKKYLGAYDIEGKSRWLSPNSTIYFPINDKSLDAEVSLLLENLHPAQIPQHITTSITGRSETAAKFEIPSNSSLEIKLHFSPSDFEPVIQNAGSFVKKSYEAGDIGFLELDRGQFDLEQEVASICGVSLFIRSKLFNQLGGFESKSFAYYEDVDLSLRARLRGWKCVYSPKSKLRHVHCGSGVENSNYFKNNVTFSRLLLASKMMGYKQWKALRKSYWSNARSEFGIYRKDLILENKPFLGAIFKYLRLQPTFIKNRIFAKFQKTDKRLANFLTD